MQPDDEEYLEAAFSRDYVPVNPIDLPQISIEDAMAGRADGVAIEPDNDDRLFWRNPAAFLDDPDAVQLFAPAEVGRVPYESPPPFLIAVTDALLLGYRTVVTQTGEFFTDEAYMDEAPFRRQLERLSRPDDFSNEETGLRPATSGGSFRLLRNGRPVRHIAGRAVFVGSDEPYSYGSFLFRVLPKAMSMRDMGLTGEPCIAFAQQPQTRELLVLAGVPEESIVLHDPQVLTRVDRLLIPGLRNPNTYFDSETRAFFLELVDAHGGGDRGRRIYVSRLGHNSRSEATRVMVNEQELIERLVALGFDIVDPEPMSVTEQIAAFASADLVIGPSGSGMFNVVFCRPGTKVIDLQSEDHWIYSYAGMYASLGLEYGIFVGRADPADAKPAHRRWEVNIEALLSRIEDFASTS